MKMASMKEIIEININEILMASNENNVNIENIENQ